MHSRRTAHLAFFFTCSSTLVACGGGGSSSALPSVTTSASPAATPTASTSATPTAGPTAVPSGTPAPVPSATVPAAEASTYALEASDIAGFKSAVDAQCLAAPVASTRFDVELIDANANALVSTLPGKTIAQAQALAARQVAFAVQIRAALPTIGFMINPLYPVLVANQTNAPSWWNAPANYPVFLAYYQTLARGLAQNGIPYDVEANIVFPAYSGQNYSGMSLAQLEAGIAEDASNVMAAMAPRYLNLSSEPLTLSQNTGRPSLDTPVGFAAFTSGIRQALIVPPGSQTSIGAGSADWSAESFLGAIEGVPGLDYYDEHLYPPDVLTTPGGGIAQVDAISPAITGKPGVITENWDEKDAGDAGNYGAANAMLLEQQDTYAFWAPLDAQYVTAMMKLARCDNLSVVNFWYLDELFAYLDYGSASAMSPMQAQATISAAAEQAVSSGTLSPSGAALYAGLTGSSPAARVPHFIRRNGGDTRLP